MDNRCCLGKNLSAYIVRKSERSHCPCQLLRIRAEPQTSTSVKEKTDHKCLGLLGGRFSLLEGIHLFDLGHDSLTVNGSHSYDQWFVLSPGASY